LLDRGLDTLSHRGPDGRGTWRTQTGAGGEIALGHTRLSIIDVEGGAQPLFSHDRRFVISFNGEIYNHLELREQLRAHGCRFLTQSDTEVMVEAWRMWGEDGLLRLRGMFAFALFDAHAERLVLARDPFGKKPLFLADVAGGVAFASEIAPLLALPGVGRRLNGAVIAPYLMARYAPSPASFFRGVRKLPPGSVAVLDAHVLRERRYFTPPLASVAPRTIRFPEAVEAFGLSLQSAVRLRLRADAPHGVYLSGGLDSSTIAALAAREVNRLQTFAVGFEETAYSELSHAARVAANLGADHQAITVSATDFAHSWPAAVRHRGAPVSEASDIPLLMLSMAAKGCVKATLTGEGADELLAGYPKHRVERWVMGYHALIPALAHRRLLAPLIRRLPYGARRFKILGRALGAAAPTGRALLWFASTDLDGVAALTGERLSDAHSGANALSPLRQVMLADQMGWLPDNLLERGDRMLMAAGIEGRAPFMDLDLAALVAGFPDHLLFDRRGGKAILRAAARDLLDPTTLHRRKVGFRTPVDDWFRGPLRPILRDLLCPEESSIRRLLNGQEIDRLLAEHLARRTDQTDLLWTLANLELFLREFGLEIEEPLVQSPARAQAQAA
jgi:asparagine synthase (glutamine-hydrolysing)